MNFETSPTNLLDVLLRYEARKILLQHLSAFDAAKLDSLYSFLSDREKELYLNPVRDLIWNLSEMDSLQGEGLRLILLGADALALQKRLQNPRQFQVHNRRKLQIYLIGTFPFQNKNKDTIDRMVGFNIDGRLSRSCVLRDQVELRRIERYDPSSMRPFLMGFGVAAFRRTARGSWHRVRDVPDRTVDLWVYVPSFQDRILDEVRIRLLERWQICRNDQENHQSILTFLKKVCTVCLNRAQIRSAYLSNQGIQELERPEQGLLSIRSLCTYSSTAFMY
jgi:hypothetical protein